MDDIIYFDFFINNEHFTCEDYSEDEVAVYCEDSFVATIDRPDRDLAYAAAVNYECGR